MNRLLILLAAAAALAGLARGQKPADDVILRAMMDELERSKGLRIAGLEERPYYTEFQLEDADMFNISATLGALMGSTRNRVRLPQVEVRAGSYDFDNTNHVNSNRYSGARYDQEQWPLDNSYAVIRHNLWLATDRAYKGALEALARKRAALRNAASPDKAPDFAKAEPAVSIQPPARFSYDEALWKKRTTDLSAIFTEYPEIYSSGVDLGGSVGNSYFVNSEGSIQRYPDVLQQLRVTAQSQTADGMIIRDGRVFPTLKPDGLPSELDLRRGVKEVAENVRALLKAPIGEGYSGPVLFEGSAAGQLLAQVLGDNLRLMRRPVTDPGHPLVAGTGELESKVGSRILPEWISAVDDATQNEWRGQELMGAYPFDMEGVAPKPVMVVEKGVLKGFLLSRQPVNGFVGSNGHGRLPGGYGARGVAISNLFVSATVTKPLAELKKQLMDMCKQQNKPYGLLVRKLDYPSSASMAELRIVAEGSRGSNTRPISPPVLVYRVYPDGREELVRGLRFRGLTVRAMRDIIAASTESSVFHFINNGALLAAMSFGGYVAPASVIAPSLLIDEIELERPQEELLSQPPLVPPPPMEGKSR